MAHKDYSKLHGLSKQAALLSSLHGLLDWDQETYMPKGAIEVRAQEIELVASLIHKQKTSASFAKALGKLIDIPSGEIIGKELSQRQCAALREWRRDYIKTVKLPASFVKTFAKTTSTAIHAWAKAKEHNDFRAFEPHLDKIVTLCRKKADILGYKEHPYDALLDLYEPEMRSSHLTPLFGRLKIALTDLLKRIESTPPISKECLSGHFAAEKQMRFGHLLLKAMGFDESTSRLDLTVHPFCAGLHPNDTRMTTRIHPDDLLSNIFSVIHEGGHGLYNAGLPVEEYGSPLCESASLGIDESQSRWWETRIGRSLAFWEHFFPHLKREFPESFNAVPLNDFYRAINIVKPSLIRTESDEVTYSLHIIVRFEIEMGLLDGSLKVKEIPDAWNDKMRAYLGIAPAHHGEGCLQDVHWSMGGFGYFPTYTLGNLYASQFFAAFEKVHSNWKERVAKGELAFIREWLHQNIYQYGREFTAEQLAIRITGSPVSEKPFVAYLENKYRHLYHL